jgi:hypothetical protein
MKILTHHIYEYKRGLRKLVLCTIHSSLLETAKKKLEQNNITYLVQKVSEHKVNIFFGAKECVEIVASFGNKRLQEYTNEEDFILGLMLGYSRIGQCKRYMKRKSERAKQTNRLWRNGPLKMKKFKAIIYTKEANN